MKCKLCHKSIWPWQSHYKLPEQLQTHDCAILIIPDYDRFEHSGCYFRRAYSQPIQQIKED